VIDGRPFIWDQVSRMLMSFEGFTLRAFVDDSIFPLDPRLATMTSSSSGIGHGRGKDEGVAGFTDDNVAGHP
jgi:hypothetical protein